MAAQNQSITTTDGRTESDDCYANCLVTPMADALRLEHVIDAVLVAGIVFFAVILGDTLLVWSNGGAAYITAEEIAYRLPTAGIAFALTFFFQAARARGIDVLEKWRNVSDE